MPFLAIPAVAVGITAAGTAASVGGAVYAGVAAKQQADYEADVANANATNAQNQAKVQEQQYRAQAAQKEGAVRAAYGAAGVTGQGSPLDILGAQSLAQEQDALLIRARGQSQANAYQEQAAAAGMRGQASLIGGGLNAAGAGLSGAGRTSILAGSGGGMTVPNTDEEDIW